MMSLDTILDHAIPRPDGFTVLGNGKEFDALPEETKDQIIFLNKPASRYLVELMHISRLVTGGGWDPFAKGNFKTVETFQEFYNDEQSKQVLKKWLFHRGLPFSQQVFLLADDDCVIVTTWKMIIRYSAEIFPFDDTAVFDRTLNWCLFFYHENIMSFGKDRVCDSTEDDRMMQELNERKMKYPGFRHPYL